jgi:glycosyltransferase involved in cell wall biosynthesis
LRREIGASPDTRVWLFAGKLIEKKRPADFIDAISRLHRRGMRVRGVVVGSGPLETALRQRAAAADAPVSWIGFRNQTAIPACYAAADGLVLPSDGRETWGLVVNEAMACGLPAVVSDAVGCHADLIDGRFTGRVSRVGDVDGLADALADVGAQLHAEPRRVRQAVVERIASYSCDAAVAGTMAALDSLGLKATPEVRRPTKGPVLAQ